MIIIHVMDTLQPRLVARSLSERLRLMPAVVVAGARQTGKSTLSRDLALGRRRYVSLDDLDTIDAAPSQMDRIRIPGVGAGEARGNPHPTSCTRCHAAELHLVEGQRAGLGEPKPMPRHRERGDREEISRSFGWEL